MALQVWLPLTGDLHNQGLNNSATISGTSSFIDNGKLGKAFNSSEDLNISLPTISGSKVWSVCFWNYLKSDLITADWTKIVYIKDGGADLRIEVCPKGKYNDVYCYCTSNNQSYLITSGGVNTPNGGQYFDTWTHFCLTSDGTTLSKYLNGVLIGTFPYNGTGAINGNFKLSSNAASYKNDFRVYDHCLSPKEVKEIAKGLVLHYPLNSRVGNNILIGTNQGTRKWANAAASGKNSVEEVDFLNTRAVKMTCTEATTSWRMLLFGPISAEFPMLKPNTTYTLSFDTDWGAQMSFSNIMESSAVNSLCKSTTLISRTDIPGGKHCVYSFVTKDSLVYTSQYIYFGNSLTTNTSVIITNLKIEEGAINTPWCPNIIDDSFTTLGYKNGIEYDCSGYQNNGEIVSKYGLNLLKNSSLINLDTFEGATTRIQCNNVTSITKTSEGLHLVTPESVGNANNGIMFAYYNADTQLGLRYGDMITFSVDIKGTDDSNAALISIFNNYTNTGSDWWYNSGISRVSSTLTGIDSNWKRYSVTMTLPWKPASPTTFRVGFGIHGNMGADLYIRNAKVEFGNSPTPYDFEAAPILLADGDAPRYKTSTKFTGNDSIVSGFTKDMDKLTCSFWVKPASNNGNYSIVVSNFPQPDTFWCATNTEGSGAWFYNGSYVKGTSLLTNNIWHHCVFVFDNGIGKWYINGVLAKTEDISSRATALKVSRFSVGNSYRYNTWNTRCYSSISDVRLYATALSETDIKELYNTSCIVTK